MSQVELSLMFHTAVLFETILCILISPYIEDFSTGSLSKKDTRIFLLLGFCFFINLLFMIYLCDKAV